MAAASISSAWLKCGDGFESTSMLEVKLLKGVRKKNPTGGVLSVLD